MSAETSARSTPPPATGTATEPQLSSEYDELENDGKLDRLERLAASDLRTEIDRILGVEHQEYSGANAHQFSKSELAVVLGLGGPQR